MNQRTISRGPVGVRDVLCLLCLLFASASPGCTDDLALSDKLFACAPEAPCAAGWECLEGICQEVERIPEAETVLYLPPAHPSVPPLGPTTGCSLITVCSRSNPGPYVAWGRCLEMDIGLVDWEAGVNYAVEAEGPVQIRVTCASNKSVPPLWSARSCPVALAEGEIADFALTMLPAGAFSNVGDAGGATVTLHHPRGYHETVLLPDQTVLVAGGLGQDGQVLDSVERLRLDSGLASSAPESTTLSVPRAHAASVVLPDGRPVIFGGEDGVGEPLQSVDIWDPSSQSFVAAPPMKRRRAWHTATAVGQQGQVALAGGRGDGGSHIELWDAAMGTLQEGELLEPRFRHTATAVEPTVEGQEGYIFLVGGEWESEEGPILRSSSERQLLGSLDTLLTGICGVDEDSSVPRTGHLAIALAPGDFIHVYGGTSSYPPGEFNPHVCTWSAAQSYWLAKEEPLLLPLAAMEQTGAAFQKDAMPGYLMSGGLVAPQPLIASPAAQRVLVTPLPGGATTFVMEAVAHPMEVARWGHGAVTLCDGTVLLVGGMTGTQDQPQPTASVEVYNP